MRIKHLALSPFYLADHHSTDNGWAKFTFPNDSQQSGLLTQMSLVAVFSHPGRSSPTLRGIGINEIFYAIQHHILSESSASNRASFVSVFQYI